MSNNFNSLLAGYQQFREQYALGDCDLLKQLAEHGQHPKAMVIACCDSRVDPSVILQCEPGDIFVVRNVANIIPPYEKNDRHHGVSAALEFGICYLNIEHLIILGHSQCGGINGLLNGVNPEQDDFLTSWVSILTADKTEQSVDACAQKAILQSYQNCFSFPWLKSRIEDNRLEVHRWFFDIENAQLLAYKADSDKFQPLVTTI